MISIRPARPPVSTLLAAFLAGFAAFPAHAQESSVQSEPLAPPPGSSSAPASAPLTSSGMYNGVVIQNGAGASAATGSAPQALDGAAPPRHRPHRTAAASNDAGYGQPPAPDASSADRLNAQELNTVRQNSAGSGSFQQSPGGYTAPAYNPGGQQSDQQDLLNRADVTLKFMRGNKDYTELDRYLPRAKAVFVVPQLIKAAFFFGGEGGNGVILARLPDGTWSAPSFSVIGSASFGLQAGAKSSEIVFVIMTDKGLNAILNRDVKLGAGVSVALITLGKDIEAGTGIDTDADIYAVAKTEGLFGGIDLDGSVINPLDGDNESYYGRKIEAQDILNGRVPPPPGAQALIGDLR